MLHGWQVVDDDPNSDLFGLLAFSGVCVFDCVDVNGDLVPECTARYFLQLDGELKIVFDDPAARELEKLYAC